MLFSLRFLNKRYSSHVIFYLGITILSCTVLLIEPSVYSKFLGHIRPLLALIIAIIICTLVLRHFESKQYFYFYKASRFSAKFIIIPLALIFGIVVITADISFANYQHDINARFPISIPFYPSIGFIAEVLFHLIPLFLVMNLLPLLGINNPNRVTWTSILIVSLIEPFFQIWNSTDYSELTLIFTFVHVLLFSLVQLIIFKRFDFISMFLFRIAYYLIWHVIWGHFRLDILFEN